MVACVAVQHPHVVETQHDLSYGKRGYTVQCLEPRHSRELQARLKRELGKDGIEAERPNQ
jgi:hypothetical protein